MLVKIARVDKILVKLAWVDKIVWVDKMLVKIVRIDKMLVHFGAGWLQILAQCCDKITKSGL